MSANTLAGFKAGFYVEHRRQPTEQEIWNAGVASGLRRPAHPMYSGASSATQSKPDQEIITDVLTREK